MSLETLATVSFSDSRMINYCFTPLEDIKPFGTAANPVMSWFGLTDGSIHLNFGGRTVYEYSPEAIAQFGDTERFNNYYLARFIEDFTEIFQIISQPLPLQMMQEIENFPQLQCFKNQSIAYLEALQTNNKFTDRELEQYEYLISWIYTRGLPAGHLIGGPIIWFFRYCEEIRIIWKADHQINPDTNLWLFPSGDFSLSYDTFTTEIEVFADRFFSDMANRVDIAISRDWGQIAIDKDNLLTEQIFRKDQFYRDLHQLSSDSKVDWSSTISLITEMKNQYRF